MKFSQITKHQTINYRLCDELTCKQIAMHTTDDSKNAKHLCETHYLRYKAELSDAKSKSNS